MRSADAGATVAAQSGLDEALDAAKRGIPVLPSCWPNAAGSCGYHGSDCGHLAKRPLFSRRYATMSRRRIDRIFAEYPNAGLKWVLPAGFLGIDVDAKNGGLATTTQWVVDHGPLPPTWADTNGSDAGGHFILRTALPFEGVLALGPGVEAFGTGAELVMPPSPHPLGGRRSWRNGCSPRDVELAAAPNWLLQQIRLVQLRDEGRRRRSGPLGVEEIAEFDDLFSTIGVASNGRMRGVYRCPFHPDRQPSLSVDWARGLFNCHATSCDARGSLGALQRLVQGRSA